MKPTPKVSRRYAAEKAGEISRLLRGSGRLVYLKEKAKPPAMLAAEPRNFGESLHERPSLIALRSAPLRDVGRLATKGNPPAMQGKSRAIFDAPRRSTLNGVLSTIRVAEGRPRRYNAGNMEIFKIDEEGHLYLSPDVDDWQVVENAGISVVIDLDGNLDIGVPEVPNHMLYIYFPIYDEDLPNLEKLHAIARLGADLVRAGHRILSHCGMGFNRSALMTGLIMTYLGTSGRDAVAQLRTKRAGALFNDVFASYLLSIDLPDKLTAH